ncbi:MAG TPA: immunoglobulin domain-containing protein [Candidatus Acidoferrales bacterium]|nr:immunoglobulin domain-containing protein [Candidatus Acidoferrales bacterium]
MKSKWFLVMAGIVAVFWNTHASPTSIVAWGDNSFGQTNVPAGLTNVVAIAQGGYHCLALSSDSTLAGWGCNYNPLDTNTYLGQATVPAGLSNAVAVSAGYDCSMLLKNDGSIMFWGDDGQTNLPDGLTNVVAIAAGERHSLVLRQDGALIAWGQNFYGETNIPAGLTNVMGIDAGCGFDSVALSSNGSVTVWGFNSYGETSIPPAATNIVAVASGLYHIMALRGDGRVVAWGYNGYGQTNVPANLSNVVAIAAGWHHCLALKKDGTVTAWGLNNAGQATVPVGLSNVVGISASRYQSMVLVNDGSPWIAQQPSSQTVFSGMSLTFNILAIGTTNVNYQWCFNGTNILGATNASLSLANVQTTNSGNYSVTLSNSVGVVMSSNVVLTVGNSLPIISQPAAQIAVALHSNTVMTAASAGSLPQYYQWQLNGTNLLRATNSFLSLTNAQLTNAGNYAVIVTNAYGSITDLVAALTVVDLGLALNATNLVWITGGSYPWFPETSTNHDGVAAAQSATPTFPQSSALQTSVTGPGTLTFWAKYAQQSDSYTFTTTGNTPQFVFIPPTQQWGQQTVYLGTGTQTLLWQFQKFSFGNFGLDAVWLDQVSFVAGATPAAIASVSPAQIVPPATNVTFTVSAFGTPPLFYRWNFNGTPLIGATNSSLSLTNVQSTNAGVYSVIVTNAYGTPVTTNVTLMVQMPYFDTPPTNMFMSSQGFNFQLGGLTGHGPVIVFASTDLLVWLPIFTNPPATGSLHILDTNAVYLPFRFYRAAEQ